MQQPNGPPGARTETERHWDQVCLTLVTIGAAVMVAVFLISGIAQDRTGPLTWDTAAKLMGGTALAIAFTALVVRAHRDIFSGETPDTERHSRKEQATRGVMEMLGTMVLGLAIWMLILMAIPPDMPLLEDKSKTIRISEENWKALEEIIETEGSADEKIGQLLEMAEEQHRTPGEKRHRKGKQ